MKRSITRVRGGKPTKRAVQAAASSYEVVPLDPWLMCGPDTTVTELWKVRERRQGEVTLHLVYFDRYGWYCEHGIGCGAVAEVRKVVRAMSANAPGRRGTGNTRTTKRK